jgi:hypothetical protein
MTTTNTTNTTFYVILSLGEITISQEPTFPCDAQIECASQSEAEAIASAMEKETWYVSTTYGTTWLRPVSQMRDDYSYDAVFYGTYPSAWREYRRRRDEEWANR